MTFLGLSYSLPLYNAADKPALKTASDSWWDLSGPSPTGAVISGTP